MRTFYSFIGQNKIPIRVEYSTHKNTTEYRVTYKEHFILSNGDIEKGYIWFRTPDDFPYDIFFIGDLSQEFPSVISKEGDMFEFYITLDKRIHKKTKNNPNGIFHMGGCGIQIK